MFQCYIALFVANLAATLMLSLVSVVRFVGDRPAAAAVCVIGALILAVFAALFGAGALRHHRTKPAPVAETPS